MQGGDLFPVGGDLSLWEGTFPCTYKDPALLLHSRSGRKQLQIGCKVASKKKTEKMDG